MRALSYILIALGICLLMSAGYDEYRGITTRPLPFTARQYHHAYLYSLPVSNGNHPKFLNNPKLFREFMTTHWICAALTGGVGWILFFCS